MNLDALNDYLETKRSASFVWGENDCLTFTNGAYQAMYGAGWCDDWLGRYAVDGKPRRNADLRSEYGFDDLATGISSKLTAIDYVAPRGALVISKLSRRYLLGYSFGISVGTKAVFLMNKGLAYYPVASVDGAWIKE